MTLISCPECGKSVSEKARSCPTEGLATGYIAVGGIAIGTYAVGGLSIGAHTLQNDPQFRDYIQSLFKNIGQRFYP